MLSSAAGPLISAGTDRCIRLWEPLRPEQSYIICGTSPAQAIYRKRLFQGVPVIDEVPCVAEQEGPQPDAPTRRMAAVRGMSLCHQDAITALHEVGGGERLLVSAARDGVVSVWR